MGKLIVARQHILKQPLDLAEPLRSDIIGHAFLHEGWYIFVPPDRVTLVEQDEQLAFAFNL